MIRLKNFLISCISIIGLLIYGILLYFSYSSTYFNTGYKEEVPVYFKDNIFLNIIIVLFILFLFFLLYKFIKKFDSKINVNFLLLITCILAVLISIIWIKSSNAAPEADQYSCVEYAQLFNEDIYYDIGKGGYVGIYQHQLGLITILRMMFVLFGERNYQSFQFLNAISLALLILSGDMIIRNSFFNKDTKRIEIFYLFFMLSCIPLYIYVTFVYGEILSIVFIFFSAWMLLSYLNKHKWFNFLFFVLGSFIACFVRLNSIIFLIASIIILLIKLLTERNLRLLILLGGASISLLMIFYVPTIIYGKYLPSNSKTTPSILYIAMGMHGENGWYDGYNYETYSIANYDPQLASSLAKEDINKSIDSFIKNPNKTLNFLKEKIAAQWNAPMFQCLNMTHNFFGSPGRLAASIYEGKLNVIFNYFSNYYQIFIYTMCFLCLIYSFIYKNNLKIENYLFFVYIIGGFLFSIMWEAKTRYILPYFICMIPYVSALLEIIFAKLDTSFKNKQKFD